MLGLKLNDVSKRGYCNQEHGTGHKRWYCHLRRHLYLKFHNGVFRRERENNKNLIVVWWHHLAPGILDIIGLGTGLMPFRCQAITWINVNLLSIAPPWTNFSEIEYKIFFRQNTFHLQYIFAISTRLQYIIRFDHMITLNVCLVPLDSTYK